MQETIRNLTIIIPVYNPDSSLVDTVDGLLKKGFQDIIVVNDGSDEGHQIPLQQIEDKCTLIHHRDRRGRDKAIRTATAFCMENRRQSSGAIIAQIEKRQRPEEIYACAENFVQNEYNYIQKARKPKRNGGCPYEETRSHRSCIGSRRCELLCDGRHPEDWFCAGWS